METASLVRKLPIRRAARRPRARTEKQLAYERRRRQERTRKQRQAAKLLAQGMTQQAVAAELGVTTRTLRNWKSAPAFRRERERQHKRAARRPAALAIHQPHDGVPIFPDTPAGRVARLAYYEARKLNNPPYSLYDNAQRTTRTRAARGTPRPRTTRQPPPPIDPQPASVSVVTRVRSRRVLWRKRDNRARVGPTFQRFATPKLGTRPQLAGISA